MKTIKATLNAPTGMICILALFFLFSPGLAAADQTTSPPETGEIVIGITENLFSKTLNEWRTLEIYLPNGHDREVERKYPLLVVLDAGDMFAYTVSLINMMAPHYFPKMVVIGIRNTDRGRDLDARKGLNENIKRFHRFLEEELLPYVEKKYRTLPYRILAGHSLAGLFTAHALATNPKLFHVYIATSPSIREEEAKGVLFKAIGALPADGLKGRYFYFTAGGEEPEALHQALHGIDKQFKARGFLEFNWDYSIDDREGHVPIKGFYQGLRNAFDNWCPSLKMFLSGTVEDIKKHYNGLTEKYGFEVVPPYAIMTSIGRRHLREKRAKEAVKIFEYYITVYPKGVNGHLSLTQAYVDDGQTAKAKETLKKVLTLDPENKRAKDWLESLK
jgi:enterochelin esterase-like enzyme